MVTPRAAQPLNKAHYYRVSETRRPRPPDTPDTIRQFLARTIGVYVRHKILPGLMELDRHEQFEMLKDPDREFDASAQRALATAQLNIRQLLHTERLLQAHLKLHKAEYNSEQHVSVLRSIACEQAIEIWIKRKLGREKGFVIPEAR